MSDNIKKEISKTISQIKANSKDSKFADLLVKRLLSLKAQSDVNPTRLYVPESDVEKEYDFGAVRFVKCKSCIIYEAKGGYYIVVRPEMVNLYLHLTVLLDMKDRYDELDDNNKKLYDAMYSATVTVLNVPIYSAIDDELFTNTALDALKNFEKYVEKKQSDPLQDETPEQNVIHNNLEYAMNMLMGDGKEDKNEQGDKA